MLPADTQADPELAGCFEELMGEVFSRILEGERLTSQAVDAQRCAGRRPRLWSQFPLLPTACPPPCPLASQHSTGVACRCAPGSGGMPRVDGESSHNRTQAVLDGTFGPGAEMYPKAPATQ